MTVLKSIWIHGNSEIKMLRLGVHKNEELRGWIDFGGGDIMKTVWRNIQN
jgi:hypothetical protein